MSLTPESLADVMEHRLPIEGYRSLFPAMNAAMVAAECTTPERAAGWLSQLGEESGGLRWLTELGNNCVNYEGRRDLGNTQPGDGCRFKGRGPIQVTGRAHYSNLSQWAFDRRLCPTPTFFVDNPDELASQQYGFIGAVWYWKTHTRPDDDDGVIKHGNQYCDERDIVGLTKWVNGGTRGLDVRERIWNHALQMGDAILPSGDATAPPQPNIVANPAWRGDPRFLPELLRAFGVDPVEYPGWLDRGHGDFGAIWGIVWHHTGNVNETNEGIAHHPALGLAANMLIHPDGQVVLTGVGVAWHAGKGVYPGLPEDGANQYTIGIECAYGPDSSGRFTLPWPDVQVETMIRVGAAITWFLGFPADHNIAHKEWAGADNPLGINKQGKPDPANFDMNWFREQIADRVEAGPTGEDELMASVTDGPSLSIYRTNDDNIGLGTPVERQTNGMLHEARVEELALLGVPWELSLVQRIADGDQAMPAVAAGQPGIQDRAKAILAKASKK